MGYARNRPYLLPDKVRLIREHLQLDHAQMAEQLVSEIESHSQKTIQIKPHWIRNFELGKHEPDLLTVNSYGRLANVSMEMIVDDTVSAEAFRKRLGTKKRVKA
jgi:DNA-binding XRE family transcriptional regulator